MKNINYNRFKYQTTIENFGVFINSKEKNYNWDYVDKYKDTALNSAICNKNIELVKFLLDRNVNVNGNRKANFYPLEIACLNGDLEVVKTLLSSPLIILNREDDQSFIYASMNNHYEIVEYLIKKDVDINKIIDERTALHWAIQEKNIETIKILLKYNADINITASPDCETPLSIAVGEGYVSVVELLLKNGADPNLHIPLIAATLNNSIEIAEILLKYKADVNAYDEYNRTALFYAKMRKRYYFEKLFLENGADMSIIDCKGIKIEDLNDEDIRKSVFIDWYYPDDEDEKDYKVVN